MSIKPDAIEFVRRNERLAEISTTQPLTPPEPVRTTTRSTTSMPASHDLPTAAQLQGLGGIAGFSFLLLVFAGVFRRRPGAPTWEPRAIFPLLGNFAAGVVAYFLGSLATAWIARAIGIPPRDAAGNISPGFLIVASAAGPLLAATAMLIGLTNRIPGGLQSVGLRNRAIGWPVLTGLGYAAAIIPITLFIANVTLIAFNAIGVPLDTVHPLLRSMDNTQPLERAIGAIAAVFIAPLAEELLFRAHLQTILRRTFARLTEITAGQSPSSEAEAIDRPLVKRRWASIAAVVVTSLLFAAIHPTFSGPAVFVLSLTLGLAYERSGTLWTSLTIHAAFNAFSTVVFLFTPHGGA